MILDKKVDTNPWGHKGLTPLHVAVVMHHNEIVLM